MPAKSARPARLPGQVRIYYAHDDKLHVLTTPEFSYVMHADKNLKRAFETLAQTVNALVYANEGELATYAPRDSFEDFSRAVHGGPSLMQPVATLELESANH